jgi:hypothetical protein
VLNCRSFKTIYNVAGLRLANVENNRVPEEGWVKWSGAEFMIWKAWLRLSAHVLVYAADLF